LKLAVFLGRSPDTATAEELRAFQLHLTATGVQPPTINATVTVPRFFFKVTLDRPEMTRHLVFVYEPRKLPRVLSPEEVLCLASRRARPIRPSRSQIRALAADACSSSRSSTPVASHTTGQQSLPSRSGSIPHEREHDLPRPRAHPEPVKRPVTPPRGLMGAHHRIRDHTQRRNTASAPLHQSAPAKPATTIT
jgi:hypothetical protein